jgi:mono/diheme cytochrome c family protein
MNRELSLLWNCLFGLTFVLPIAAQFACNKGAEPGRTGATTTSATDGPSIFTANCSKCHSVNGSGAKRAPDLTHVGADSEHTTVWLADFIKNPSSKKPGSRMPPFEGKISDSDLKSLTDYLVSLK